MNDNKMIRVSGSMFVNRDYIESIETNDKYITIYPFSPSGKERRITASWGYGFSNSGNSGAQEVLDQLGIDFR